MKNALFSEPFQMVFSFSVSVEKNDFDVTSCAKQI